MELFSFIMEWYHYGSFAVMSRAATYRRTGEIPPSPTLLYHHVRESDRTWHRYQPVVGNPIRD
jgi:hypothetical protein